VSTHVSAATKLTGEVPEAFEDSDSSPDLKSEIMGEGDGLGMGRRAALHAQP
jgi:hypothetical protein